MRIYALCFGLSYFISVISWLFLPMCILAIANFFQKQKLHQARTLCNSYQKSFMGVWEITHLYISSLCQETIMICHNLGHSNTNNKIDFCFLVNTFLYGLPFYLKLLAGAEQARVFSIVILAFRAGVLQKELL